jgi:PASTA domain
MNQKGQNTSETAARLPGQGPIERVGGLENKLPGLREVTPVVVPKLIGMPAIYALEVLGKAGFRAEELTVTSDLDPGFVISQNPAAGEQVPFGSVVEFTVRMAKGSPA